MRYYRCLVVNSAVPLSAPSLELPFFFRACGPKRAWAPWPLGERTLLAQCLIRREKKIWRDFRRLSGGWSWTLQGKKIYLDGCWLANSLHKFPITERVRPPQTKWLAPLLHCFALKQVRFTPYNYRKSPIYNLQLRNRTTYAIQLSKSGNFSLWGGFESGFPFCEN